MCGMEKLEETILDVLDGMNAPDDMMLFIYPTDDSELFDVELRLGNARARFEVLCYKIPLVTLVENRKFDPEFVRRFQSELIDMLY